MKVLVAEYSRLNVKNKKPIEEVRILGEHFSSKVSCLKYDIMLANHFVDEFDKKFKTNAKDNPISMIKLLKATNKLKETLSANKESSFFIESFFEDRDL